MAPIREWDITIGDSGTSFQLEYVFTDNQNPENNRTVERTYVDEVLMAADIEAAIIKDA